MFGGRDGYEVLPEKMGFERGAVINLTKREEECWSAIQRATAWTKTWGTVTGKTAECNATAQKAVQDEAGEIIRRSRATQESYRMVSEFRILS